MRHACGPLTTMHNPHKRLYLRRIANGSNTTMHPSYRINGKDFILCGHPLNWFLLCSHRILHRNTCDASVAAQDIGHICASQTSHSDETFIYFHCRFALCTPHTNKVEHIIDKMTVCVWANTQSAFRHLSSSSPSSHNEIREFSFIQSGSSSSFFSRFLHSPIAQHKHLCWKSFYAHTRRISGALPKHTLEFDLSAWNPDTHTHPHKHTANESIMQ